MRVRGFIGSRKKERFEVSTKPHLDALYRTAYRMTGHAQTAEDAVQETCLKAFRAFHTFQTGTNYRAWLFRIMTNTCIDWRQRNVSFQTVDIHSLPEGFHRTGVWQAPGTTDAGPEINILHKAFREDVLRAVARLQPKIRLVVVLVVFEEYTYAEIAEIIDCPVGTVRSRLHRGRQQLRVDLSKYQTSPKTGKNGTEPACSQPASGAPLHKIKK